ncbi:putative aminophospholipid translocase regulatory protein NDAI_0K02400 [Naumovozyma dairenensis CBS 421]|uniref:Cell division control protein 50 n=1 Tax=Naumovozyma dairenensis (strain ATCC 10597 / BCRC 20456 / CBS 421 / NBRC 0211 / NRRL Y-12639) TaxID=1071378 RepID=G0WI20_NAUDC|nr:hypothetical protein NDAI_0K02400 [Naumovozyma dairenensis CBS 421]CCD27431.1 hypothetical protein NDAI_0K02400 [Naumovozyma dairenensis CBS 421]
MIIENFPQFWKRTTGDNNEEDDKNKTAKKKSRRPLNTGFRQQRLKAWQPILSPQTVFPVLIFLACIFAPIGIGLMVSAINVQDLVVDYTQCHLLAIDTFTEIPSNLVSYHFKKKINSANKPAWRYISNGLDDDNVCQLKFEVPNNVKSPIYIYYKLTNFNQNHREYVESFDIDQLKGDAIPLASLDDNCDPLKGNDEDKIIYPCGLIANSMFNDTFSVKFISEDHINDDYNLSSQGIAWSTDKRHRYGKTKYNSSQIIPPPNWYKMFPNGYNDSNIPNLKEWEEFQVWMRTAALPTFYKKALQNEKDELMAGVYTMNITLNYPVMSFGGTKNFVMTTNSIVGARNISLGIVYLIVAGICTVFSVIFIMKVLFQPRSMNDHSYLDFTSSSSSSNNNNMNSRSNVVPSFEIESINDQNERRSMNSLPIREIL